MLKERDGQLFTKQELAELRDELIFERARLERTLAAGDVSSEHHEVMMALQRMEDDAYGLCEVCSSPMPIERLRVMPMTRHCVHCAF